MSPLRLFSALLVVASLVLVTPTVVIPVGDNDSVQPAATAGHPEMRQVGWRRTMPE